MFQQLYEDAKRAGESAVVITISSKLSGTYQSACLAAADYENVYVIDSLSAAIGTGILAEYAIGCAEAGMDAVSLAAHLEQKRADICVIACSIRWSISSAAGVSQRRSPSQEDC